MTTDLAAAAVASADLEIWLAGPPARASFHADSQTEADRLRWQQITSERRHAEWEVSRALLAEVRRAHAGDQQSDQALGGTHISLSHSGGYAAVAVSTLTRTGVDLEVCRERDVLRLARFAFAPREVEQLEALPESERTERFYILWTLKEAFAKALTLPLLESVSRCTFSEELGEWRGSVPSGDAWIARSFRIQPSLVLSAVAQVSDVERFRIATREWCVTHTGADASSWMTLASFSTRAATERSHT